MQKIIALAIASLSALALTAHAQYAATVVSYSPGTGGVVGFTNAATATGAPSTINPYFDNTDPFDPPYGDDQIVSVGAGGSLTLRFDAPVVNSAGNKFGLDFIVYGNSGFIITNDFDLETFTFVGEPATDGSLFGNNTGRARVSVSADGTNFFLLNTNVAPQVDNLFPPDGAADACTPVNPTLTADDFAGATLAGIRTLYDGSGGGTGFDIAWAQDGSGNPVTLSAIRYVRIEVVTGKVEIDAVTAVAPLITAQPVSRVVTAAGTDVTFSVTAVSSSALSYQWYFNGVAIEGATGASLVLSNAFVTANAGNYTVLVTGAGGSVLSSVATLSKPVPTAAYYGLFYESNEVKHASSGYFTFTVASARTRTLSGKLLMQGSSYVLTGTFGSNHVATATVLRPGKSTLTVTLQLLTANSADEVVGTVSDGTWTATLGGYSSAFSNTNVAPQLGVYSMTLLTDSNGDEAPSYGSYGTVTVRTNGALSVSGSLSDLAPFNQSTYLTKNGQWPFYASIHGGKGSLLGWVTFTNAPTYKLTGDVSWLKTNANGAYYSHGYTNNVTLLGGRRSP